jgi:hypothetical protein
VRSKFKPAGRFARRFTQIGFLAGAVIPFCFGYYLFNPPPLPPGLAYCGGAALLGLCIMVFGTPLVAVTGAIAGWFMGCILDSKRNPE